MYTKSSMTSYREIEHEFSVTLGYIRDDINALCRGSERLNYTVALLVGVACEALEDAGAYPDKILVLSELLPDSDWRKLTRVLFEALRHGLAHNFDTKHINIDGKLVQIYMAWDLPHPIEIKMQGDEEQIRIGTRVLGIGICKKIEEFRAKLRNDADARERFRSSLNRSSREVKCDGEVWRVLRRKAVG